MTSKKVPLVHYVDGERKIIGEAVVDLDGPYIDVTAKVTDPEYAPNVLPSSLSFGYSVYEDQKTGCPVEAAVIPPLSFPRKKGSW